LGVAGAAPALEVRTCAVRIGLSNDAVVTAKNRGEPANTRSAAARPCAFAAHPRVGRAQRAADAPKRKNRASRQEGQSRYR
jgi:hypothetical protein